MGGSNTHLVYNYTGDCPTDLSLENFSPHYLAPQFARLRPLILTVVPVVSYGNIYFGDLCVAGSKCGTTDFSNISNVVVFDSLNGNELKAVGFGDFEFGALDRF